MELLAPVGTLPAFEAALAAGADAFYVGAPGLNARAVSRDFTSAEIMTMVVVCHERGKKLYMALNSLIKEEELPLLLSMLTKLERRLPDALIIQDIGLLHLLRRVLPDMPIHASTLMGVNNSMAAEFCQQQGFSRVVLARELSLQEIAAIHQHSRVDLEIFVHGAMCFSYSGLCRFSSLHGGRSSLRGRCVQPCRRRYAWAQGAAAPSTQGRRKAGQSSGTQAGGHFFSMSDLCGLDHLAAIRKAGVISLKIEGRLRSVAYVANTVRAYRLVLDSLDAGPEQQADMLIEAKECLKKAMARRLTSGFLPSGEEERGKIIQPHLSGSTGELVGRTVRPERGRKSVAIKAGQGQGLQVLLQADLRLGDRLRFYKERSDERLSFSLRKLELKGRSVPEAKAGQLVRLTDPALDALPSEASKAQGLLFRVDVATRKEGISKELARRIAAIQHELPSPPQQAGETTSFQTGKQKKTKSQKTVQWWVHASSLSTFRMLHLPFPVSRLLLDLNPDNVEWFRRQRPAERQATPLIWTLPPLILEQHLAWYRSATQVLREQGEYCFQIGHLGQISLFLDPELQQVVAPLEIYGDYSLNALNSAALQVCVGQGLAGLQFCLETDRANLLAALDHFQTLSTGAKNVDQQKIGLLVYGRPPLFAARLDAPHFRGQRGLVSSRGERYYLDRGPEFLALRSQQPFSLLPFVAELKQIGLDYLVVDLRYGQPKKEAATVASHLRSKDFSLSPSAGNYAAGLT